MYREMYNRLTPLGDPKVIAAKGKRLRRVKEALSGLVEDVDYILEVQRVSSSEALVMLLSLPDETIALQDFQAFSNQFGYGLTPTKAIDENLRKALEVIPIVSNKRLMIDHLPVMNSFRSIKIYRLTDKTID